MYFSVQLSNSSELGPVSCANLYQLDLRHLVGIKRDRIGGTGRQRVKQRRRADLKRLTTVGYLHWAKIEGDHNDRFQQTSLIDSDR